MDEMERARRELADIQKKMRADLADLADIPALTEKVLAETAALESAPAPEKRGPDRMMMVPFTATDLSGSADKVFSERLGEQVMGCLALPYERGQAECDRWTAAALGGMREIGARDGLEGMVAAQMVAAQNAGLEFLSRAVRTKRPEHGNHYGRLSTQLMTLFVRQTELLQRLRGRERRSVRVEHERVDRDGRTNVRTEREQVR